MNYNLLYLALLVGVAQGQVELDLVRGVAYTLRNLNGNCSWLITIEGTDVMDLPLSVGPERTIKGTDAANLILWRCDVNGEIELETTFAVSDDTPPPTNLSVTNQETLEWSHNIPIPSGLPQNFTVTIEANVSYTVFVTDSDDSTRSLTANTTSIDISGTLDSCTTRTFTVQAVISDEYQSPNSSSISISNFSVPLFPRLSAVLVRENDSYSILVMFELGTECLLSVFNLTIDNDQTSSLVNVTSDDIERGNVTFNLNISPVDVCSVRGVVSGGNDIGESQPVSIQLPPECDITTTTIVTVPPSTTVTTSEPTPTTQPPSDASESTNNDDVVIGVTVSVVIVVVAAAVIIMLVLVYVCCFKHRRKEKITGDSTFAVTVVGTETTAGTTDTTAPSDGNDGARQNPTKPLNYTFVEPQPTNLTQPIPLETRTNYTQIDHLKTGELIQDTNMKAANGSQENNSGGKPGSVSRDPSIVGLSVDLHLEPLMMVLAAVKGDWFNLGLQLKLSENFLDETETNIESEEECLREILQNWLKYQGPTMEALNHALIEAKHNPIMFDTTRQEFVRAVDL